jgi:hypothetical protein
MTRLNLAQTCLLDVSGELGAKAKAQLQEHVAKYPAALVEHELTRVQFDLLRSMPKPEFSEERKRLIAAQIKRGIHLKLREKELKIAAGKRWKIVYHALAGASALAACLVIYASVQLMVKQVEEDRRQAIAKAEQSMRDYLDTDAANMTDFAFDNVASEIKTASEKYGALATSEVSHQAMQKLADDLNNNDDDDLPPGVNNDPGVL